MIEQVRRRLQRKRHPGNRKREGFSLIEVILGIALVGIAMLGLAQLFLLGVRNNARSEQISNATFLAQQQVDSLRTLTATELNVLSSTPLDETLDVNNDGLYDYRRITRLVIENFSYRVSVWVFAGEHNGVDLGELLGDPQRYKMHAAVNSVIAR